MCTTQRSSLSFSVALLASVLTVSGCGGSSSGEATTPQAATPTFSPAAGASTTGRFITLASTTPGAKVYFSTATTPTADSFHEYLAPIPVTATVTVTAVAKATGYLDSAPGTAAYVVNLSSTNGSCTLPATSTCVMVDEGMPASDLQAACVNAGGAYSASPCPVAGRVGRCTFGSSNGGPVLWEMDTVYASSGGSAAFWEADCYTQLPAGTTALWAPN